MAVVTVKLTIGTVSVEVSGPRAYVDKKFDKLVTEYLSSRKALSGEPSACTKIIQLKTKLCGNSMTGGREAMPEQLFSLQKPG